MLISRVVKKMATRHRNKALIKYRPATLFFFFGKKVILRDQWYYNIRVVEEVKRSLSFSF